jgi:hypothetical protein
MIFIIANSNNLSVKLLLVEILINNSYQEGNIMTQTIANLLERLAEMFPKQTYQSQLEQYIQNHRPASVAEVEYLERQYSKMNRGGLI